MRVEALLMRRQESDCLVCPDPLPCTCTADQECVRINRDCATCALNKCVAKSGRTSKSSGGVSKGALAGAVIGVLVLLALSILLFLWFRRKARLRALSANRDIKDIPAPASTVLNRPDPIEKPPTIFEHGANDTTQSEMADYDQTDTSPPLGPPYTFSRDPTQPNPFDDANSIQTAGTGGTNVIPIALVSPGSQQPSLRSGTNSATSATSNGPVRPARTPDLDLNLEHVNVSKDDLRTADPYAVSTRSGISAVSSARHSYMSNMTSASEMLNEAPMIMTPTKGPVRQVLGVVKAEMINAGSLAANPSTDGLKPPPFARPSVGSPLAATSFGPHDIVLEADEPQETADPFSDKHASTNANFSVSPPPSASTFGPVSRQERESSTSNWVPHNPNLPWARQGDDSTRPSSMATQAGSVIDIASAQIVNVGLATPGTANSTKSYRTTMGRLVSPSAGPSALGTLEEQQAWALAHAQAQAQAQGFDKPRPVSGSSVLSATSTRADSILESFPFVPPSPISNRPIRSPPVSPLGQQSFAAGSSSPLAKHTFVVAPPSPLPNDTFKQQVQADSQSLDYTALPAPPSRHTLGLSTGSQLSTLSTGLGSFPFQIDSGTDRPESGMAPPAFPGRQRASLDTLALTSDLSSYPLGFDRDSVPVPTKPRK